MSRLIVTAEPGKQEIRMTRDFDAPRDLVFKAFTDPKHLPNWWGPRNLTTIVDKMDVKPGGEWRYIQREPDGKEYAFRGVYHSIVPAERIISTFEFEPLPGHVLLETTNFESLPDGKTRLTVLSVYQSIEDRDGMVASGMESGASESYERFDELLKTLVPVG